MLFAFRKVYVKAKLVYQSLTKARLI